MLQQTMATLAVVATSTVLPTLALTELVLALNDRLCQAQPDETVADRAARAVRERRAALTAAGITAAATATVPGRRVATGLTR